MFRHKKPFNFPMIYNYSHHLLPIINPKDPRINYQNNEKRLLAHLQEKIMNYEKMQTGAASLIFEEKAENDINKNLISFLIGYAQKNIEFSKAASDEDAEYSKLMVLDKKILSEHECSDFNSYVLESNYAIADKGISPIQIIIKERGPLIWNFSSSILEGHENVYLLDFVSRKEIGRGNIGKEDNGELFIAVDELYHSVINRDITTYKDLLITVFVEAQ